MKKKESRQRLIAALRDNLRKRASQKQGKKNPPSRARKDKVSCH